MAQAATQQYTAPSSTTAQSELAWLGSVSNLVQDELPGPNRSKIAAATVSFGLLRNIASLERFGLGALQNAMTSARTFDPNPERQVDRALANVGALLAAQVEGRVSTEVDPRLANDKAGMVAKARALAALYDDLAVPPAKLLFRLPATWAGICASKELEAAGLATQMVMVYSFIQGVAAAQAGASLVNPRVGRTRDFYVQNPGVIRDPHGPRQDAGIAGGVDPGISLVTQLYNYFKVHHPKTLIMASSIRSREDALALSGCDYLLLPAKVMAALDTMPTMAGYNDGLSTSATDADGPQPALSPEKARLEAPAKLPAVTEESFNEGLGYAGSQLLARGLTEALKDVEALAALTKATTGRTST